MFYIVQSTMGFAGDDEIEIIEAETSGIAQDEKHEYLAQNIEAHCLGEFETQDEADNYMEENGYA